MATPFDYKNPDVSKVLLAPISPTSPVGENLFYDPFYDQIKEARREDDPTLSQGVWQRELKKSDWQLAESLCVEALSKKTKDLQIAGWLAEAWIMLHHLDGFQEGVKLVQSLSESFWEKIYPEMQEEDKERRLHFYEWFDNTLGERLSTIPFIEDSLSSTLLSLSDWMLASRLDNVAKRAPEPQKVIRQAVQRNEMTMDRIHQNLQSCPKELFEGLNLQVSQSLTFYDAFKKSLDDLLKDQSRPAMNTVPDALREMQKFLKAGLDLQPALNKTDVEADLSSEEGVGEGLEVEMAQPAALPLTRENAYKMIGEIADFLQTSDPHSPAPALLKKISTWENKSITDIFNDFGDSPETWAALAKILGRSG